MELTLEVALVSSVVAGIATGYFLSRDILVTLTLALPPVLIIAVNALWTEHSQYMGKAGAMILISGFSLMAYFASMWLTHGIRLFYINFRKQKH